MFEVIDTLRLQYQGSLPVTSLENYINAIEDVSRKSQEVDDKLNEVEDIRILLVAKQNVFEEILDITKIQCLMEEEKCPHLLQITINVRFFFKCYTYICRPKCIMFNNMII